MDCIISIIIPFYCTPKKFFDKCIKSILDVQSSEIEIIVIDDGSPEEFLPILSTFSNYSRVKIIHTQNAGVSAARNRGIQEASGEWILFVDSDDYMDTDALQKVIKYAFENEGDVVIFNGCRDKEGKIKYNTTFLKEGINYAADEKQRISVMESALAVGRIPRGYRQYFSLGAPYCKLLRTVFLRKNNLKFDVTVKFAEDTLFSLNVYQKAKDIRFVDLNLYYYVFYPESATRRYRPGLTDDMDIFFESVDLFLKTNGLKEKLIKAYYTRVEFEIGRSIGLEFFHPENDARNSKAAFLAFINKEPYATALNSNYFKPYGAKNHIKRFLIKHGYGRLYVSIQNVLKIMQ